MDAVKGVDKTNMALDDIIKLERKNVVKRGSFKNSNVFVRNSINRAKLNAVNRSYTAPFNKNRLGIVKKRNFIKTNIVVNKRVNVKPNLNGSRNESLNIVPASFKRTKVLNSVPAIRITTKNDQHETFKRNNVERRPFNRSSNSNPIRSNEQTFTKRSYGGNNRSYTDNERNRLPYNNNNNNVRHNNLRDSSYQEYRPMQPPRLPEYSRRTLTDSRSNRQSISYKNVKEYTLPRESFRSSLKHDIRDRPYSNQNKHEHVDRRSNRDNSDRSSDRLREREYGVMARALIEAHRDSRSKNEPSRYENYRQNVYRR